ncbi:uncharacterized protein At3g28850-like, partial [Hibiscus syriacus]|uniref:uncharacterized protein At3g28850-like n=1 Tax=Hibiscus syriacus TaxID=106335 RepID=UPI001923DF26
SKVVLQDLEPKHPAGGENVVVVYTTTLKGIRKTFEECNTVRSIIEAKRNKRNENCGGVRFVMCKQCNWSFKVLDKEQKKIMCGECNENGLIQCPICC